MTAAALPQSVPKKDTIQVVVFDVHESNVRVTQDWCHTAFLFFLHEQCHKLVDGRHVNVTPVVARYEHLNATGEFERTRIAWNG